MTEMRLTKLDRITTFGAVDRMIAMALLGIGGALTGCVNVTAPDKPIEINLNISVTQDVVVRLDGEAKSLIQQNPGIF